MGLWMWHSKVYTMDGCSHGSFSVPTGKRICLGESIARNELFLFFTSILQNFSVASPVASKDIDLTPKESGIGKIPPTYQICFLARWLGWGSQVAPLLLRMALFLCLWESCWKLDCMLLLTSFLLLWFSTAGRCVLPCEWHWRNQSTVFLDMWKETSGVHISCWVTSLFLPIAQVRTYQLSMIWDLC